MTLFDYLDAFVVAYFDDVPLAELNHLPPVEFDHADAFMPSFFDHAGIEAVFGGLGHDVPPMLHDVPGAAELAAGAAHADAAHADAVHAETDGLVGSPADAWLSGHEWSGEAHIGGESFTHGTWDPSGEGNHVISVDGEVLDLP